MMIFREFKKMLNENVANEKLQHLTHLEDVPVIHGSDGIDIVESFVRDISRTIQGQVTNLKISTKYDGSPSLVFGYDKAGKFFVATKAAFAKSPKLNYTSQDISKNYNEAPGLADKLNYALKYLPSVTPKKPGLMLQGDYLYTKPDLQQVAIDDSTYVIFQPNLIIYGAKEGTDLYKQIMASEMGIVIHTEYRNGKAIPNTQKFASNKNVFVETNQTNAAGKLSKTQITQLNAIIKSIITLGNSLRHFSADISTKKTIQDYILRYTNYRVRTGQNKNEYTEFKNFIIQQLNDKSAKLKSDRGKAKAEVSNAAIINWIDKNKTNINKFFTYQNEISNIKITFLKLLESNNKYALETFVDNNGKLSKTSPEGFVVTDNTGRMIKLVDREVFSRLNFAQSKNRKEELKPTIVESKTAVFTFGRFNPPTKGHQKLVEAVQTKANQVNGEARIYPSHTQDKKKNPLPYQSKLQYLRKYFGDIVQDNAKAVNPFVLLDILIQDGFNNIIMVVGEDRVQEFKNAMSPYMAKIPDLTFDVVSAGQRDADADGVEGISASKMREAAKAGDYETFAAMAIEGDPSTTKQLYDEIRQYLTETKIPIGSVVISEVYASQAKVIAVQDGEELALQIIDEGFNPFWIPGQIIKANHDWSVC